MGTEARTQRQSKQDFWVLRTSLCAPTSISRARDVDPGSREKWHIWPSRCCECEDECMDDVS